MSLKVKKGKLHHICIFDDLKSDSMFIGHFAVAMAGKKVQPTISLGILFLAAQFLDLLWPTLLLLGIEHVQIEPGISSVTPLRFTHYPISHSLLLVLGWGILFGAVYFLITRNRGGAYLLAGLVVSHWFLDLLVHIPDLPLYPGSVPKWGLGLWNSVGLTVLIEGMLLVTGVAFYVSARRLSRSPVAPSFWVLVAFLIIIYTMNLLGPLPPGVAAIAWAGQLQWLFIVWAWWIDRQR